MCFQLNYYKIGFMKRILVLTPKSIAGKLIMDNFADALEVNKCLVKKRPVDKLSAKDLESFKPDAVLGYDYSYLMDEKCTKIVEELNCNNLFFYFADEPKSKLACGDKKGLYEKLKKTKSTIFVWDKDFVGEFENCFFLPLAANTFKYATNFSGYNYTITFVGRPLTEKRQEILCELVKVFKNKLSIFCFEKHFLKSVEEIRSKNLLDETSLTIYSTCWKGFVEEEEELAKIYNSSKINLNITEQGNSSLNYRVFEVLAAGGFLITDEREDLNLLFESNKYIETYKNTAALIDKIEFYLQNLNIAQKMAQIGRFRCVEKHSFNHRANFILKQLCE